MKCWASGLAKTTSLDLVRKRFPAETTAAPCSASELRLVCAGLEVVVGDVSDESLRLPRLMADDCDIAFHGIAVDVHLDRVARFASSDHRGPNRVSAGVGHVNGLSDLYLHDRNSRSLLPNVRSAMITAHGSSIDAVHAAENARRWPARSGRCSDLFRNNFAGVWKVDRFGLPVVSEFQGGPLRADVQGCPSESTDRVQPDVNRETRQIKVFPIGRPAWRQELPAGIGSGPIEVGDPPIMPAGCAQHCLVSVVGRFDRP
jgi:hypothetical protein